MVIYLLVGIAVFLPFILVLKILPLDAGGDEIESPANLVFVIFLNISFVLAAWIMLKWIDRRPAAMLGLNFWPSSIKEFLYGAGIGLANFALVFLILLSLGWISIGWAGFQIADLRFFFFSLLTFFVFASFEELINRGYLFQTLCEGVGILPAALIISLIFALVHVINPAFSILAGIFLFIHGLLYTLVYLRTRSLWTPIGLHLAWNFAQGSISGLKVSGTATKNSLLSSEISGPDLLTGGGFGVEGGLIAIIVSAIILLILLKANWLKPSRRFVVMEKGWMAKTGK